MPDKKAIEKGGNFMKLTDAEWSVMDVLWENGECSLKEITDALMDIQKWSKKTVHTYLTRMNTKGLVTINREQDKPYSAAVSRETCARQEREELCQKVYKGATGDLIAAFLKESAISQEEIIKLRNLLDDMEV